MSCRPARRLAPRATATVLAGLAGVTCLAAPASAHEALVLSSVTEAGVQGNGPSGTFGVSLSGDGSTVAFSSTATTLSPDDEDAEADVYVKSLSTGRLQLASTSSDGRKASTFSVRPSLDATGRWVAFLSAADDLHPADTDGHTDVFVKDLVTGELRIASVDALGVKHAASSGPPALSADGRRVAFSSRASLVPEDTDSAPDVYVKDLGTGAVHLASRRADGSGAEAGPYGIGLPSLSADGTRVAFDTDAALDPRDTDTAPDVYVKDVVTGELLLSSLSAQGGGSSAGSYRPSLSHDGQRVAFDSTAADLSPEDPIEDADVFVKDLRSGQLLVASTTSSGTGAEGRSTDAALAGDGRTVVFSSEAGFGQSASSVLQTWVKDLDTGSVELVSTDAAGAPSDAVTISPRSSADGSTFAFTTPAALLDSDVNGWADVYVGRRSPAPPPVDGAGPEIVLSATPGVLRAGRWTSVRISGSATDLGSGLASLRLTVTDEYGRTSSLLQPRLAAGQRSVSWRWTVALPGRSRAHDLDGRQFTVSATAEDVSGNTAQQHVSVRAPVRYPHRAAAAHAPGRGRTADVRHGIEGEGDQ